MVEEYGAQCALSGKGEGWTSNSYWNDKFGGVDRVVTATCRQGALRDYHIGPLELQEDGQTGGIWLGSQATAAEE